MIPKEYNHLIKPGTIIEIDGLQDDFNKPEDDYIIKIAGVKIL